MTEFEGRQPTVEELIIAHIKKGTPLPELTQADITSAQRALQATIRKNSPKRPQMRDVRWERVGLMVDELVQPNFTTPNQMVHSVDLSRPRLPQKR